MPKVLENYLIASYELFLAIWYIFPVLFVVGCLSLYLDKKKAVKPDLEKEAIKKTLDERCENRRNLGIKIKFFENEFGHMPDNTRFEVVLGRPGDRWFFAQEFTKQTAVLNISYFTNAGYHIQSYRVLEEGEHVDRFTKHEPDIPTPPRKR